MNWLICGKMFTYFYNKFRPVNRMYYKNVVQILHYWHNSGYCIRSVAPWNTVLSRHIVFTKRVMYYKFTFVWYSAKQGTTHRPTSHLARCVPFLWPREERRWQRSQVDDFAGQCLLWWLLLRLAAAFVFVVVCGVVLTYEDCRLFGCDSVQTGRCVSAFQKNHLRDDRGIRFCEPNVPIYHITRHHITAAMPYEPHI